MTVKHLIALLQRDADMEAKVMLCDWASSVSDHKECNTIILYNNQVILNIDCTVEGIKIEKHLPVSS